MEPPPTLLTETGVRWGKRHGERNLKEVDAQERIREARGVMGTMIIILIALLVVLIRLLVLNGQLDILLRRGPSRTASEPQGVGTIEPPVVKTMKPRLGIIIYGAWFVGLSSAFFLILDTEFWGHHTEFVGFASTPTQLSYLPT